MKSGRKIFRKLEAAADPQAAIRKLSNGSLRSLARYLSTGGVGCRVVENVMGLVIVEGFDRWKKKGKGKMS